jgi:spore coat polysaccharide biosynthesis protein SpsF (cytidylyltransferase family)
MFKHFAVLIISLAVFVPIAASQGRSNPAPQVQAVSALTPESTSSDPQRFQQQQMGRLFAERQAQLRIDTAKLLALTTELKAQVDKTSVNILSMDVVKKAQEIQKLAKSVQDKMKNGY